MKKNKPRKRKIKAVSKKEVTPGTVILPALTVALHPNWGHPNLSLHAGRTAQQSHSPAAIPISGAAVCPGLDPADLWPKEQPSHSELIIFKLYLLKTTKSRRVGRKREARRSNHLHFSDSFMHLFQAGFAESLIKRCKALLQALQRGF